MDLEDGHALGQDRQGDGDLAIEAPRTQEGGVEHLGPVCRRHDDDPGGRVEAVHLGQQLVQRLLASSLETTAPEPERRWPMASISSMKMMAGARLRRLGEQVADPGRPHPHEQLDEARPADREEGGLGLPSHGTGQQRLAGARRTHHQDAPGGHGARLGIALGLLEEVDHFADLDLGPLIAGHIGKGRGRTLLVEDLGL